MCIQWHNDSDFIRSQPCEATLSFVSPQGGSDVHMCGRPTHHARMLTSCKRPGNHRWIIRNVSRHRSKYAFADFIAALAVCTVSCCSFSGRCIVLDPGRDDMDLANSPQPARRGWWQRLALEQQSQSPQMRRAPWRHTIAILW